MNSTQASGASLKSWASHKQEAFSLSSEAVKAAVEVKAKDIAVLDVSAEFGLADFFVIASGRSDRQVIGIANRILERLHKQGISPLAVEGLREGQWVVLDFGDTVVHIFYEPARAYYDLEGLWAAAPRLLIQDDEREGVRLLQRAA